MATVTENPCLPTEGAPGANRPVSKSLFKEPGSQKHDRNITWPLHVPKKLSDQTLGIKSLDGDSEWPPNMQLSAICISSAASTQSQAPMGGLLRIPIGSEKQLGYALQIDMGELQVRIIPSIISWPPDANAAAHIRQYCQTILPGCPGSIAFVPLHTVTTDEAGLSMVPSIDWTRILAVTMDGKDEHVPVWLPGLLVRVDSLQRLEAVGRLAEVGPVPNPLRMEAVLGSEFGSSKQAFQVFCLQGEKTMKLILAIAFHLERPSDDACQMERCVKEEVCCERLATLFAESGLLAELTGEMESVNMRTAANVLSAIIGAFIGEKAGDFCSVVQLWQWLTDNTPPSLTDALRFLDHTPTKVQGRTQTIISFMQVEVDGIVELHVDFDVIGWVRLRRPAPPYPLGSFVLKQDVDEGDGTWMSVQYDGVDVAYKCCVWFKGEKMIIWLPNKIMRWLRGVYAIDLVKTKQRPKNGLALREMLDGSLRVLDKNGGGGWHVYTRGPQGGLGFETTEKGTCAVQYSERCKWLFASSQENSLSKHIHEWLTSGKSLYHILRSADIPMKTINANVHVVELTLNHMIWESDGSHWKCSRHNGGKVVTIPKLPVIFTAGLENQTEEEVEYHGGCISVDGTNLPQEVLHWMALSNDRECVEVSDAAVQLDHPFNNQMLLLEALTQNTGTGTATVNAISTTFIQPEMRIAKDKKLYTQLGFRQYYNDDSWERMWNAAKQVADTHMVTREQHVDEGIKQCLAFIGNTLVEQVSVRLFVENAPFATAATLSRHDHMPDFGTGPSTFAVGAPVSPLGKYQWPADCPGLSDGAHWESIPILGLDICDPQRLAQRLDTCCNNIAYAKTCVDLGLHKSMLECSQELAERVSSFVKVCSRSERDENPWPRLLRHDAPQELGNTFLACLGAMIMDGAHGGESRAYLDVKTVVVKHIKACLAFPIDVESADKMREAHDKFTESDQSHKAPNATDFDDVYGQEWLLRSTILRLPYASSEYQSLDQSDDEDEVEEMDEAVEGPPEPPGRPGPKAVYCEVCQEWYNGPTQFENHEIGKKHKKERNRQLKAAQKEMEKQLKPTQEEYEGQSYTARPQGGRIDQASEQDGPGVQHTVKEPEPEEDSGSQHGQPNIATGSSASQTSPENWRYAYAPPPYGFAPQPYLYAPPTYGHAPPPYGWAGPPHGYSAAYPWQQWD